MAVAKNKSTYKLLTPLCEWLARPKPSVRNDTKYTRTIQGEAEEMFTSKF